MKNYFSLFLFLIKRHFFKFVLAIAFIYFLGYGILYPLGAGSLHHFSIRENVGYRTNYYKNPNIRKIKSGSSLRKFLHSIYDPFYHFTVRNLKTKVISREDKAYNLVSAIRRAYSDTEIPYDLIKISPTSETNYSVVMYQNGKQYQIYDLNIFTTQEEFQSKLKPKQNVQKFYH